MSLKRSVEQAACLLIQSAGTYDGQTYTSQRSQTAPKQTPCIVAEFQPQDPTTDAKGGPTGNQWGVLNIRVETNADAQDGDAVAPDAQHSAYVEAIRDIVQTNTLAVDLTTMGRTVGEFTCIGVVATSPPDYAPEDRLLVDVLSYRLYCAEANL